MFGVLPKHRQPIDERLGYEVANVSGTLCQCPENIREFTPGQHGYPIPPFNRRVDSPPYVYLPDNPAVSQKRFQMRNAGNVFMNTPTTPNPYTTEKVEPNYDRRYTVIPTPAIGLYAVTVFDDAKNK